MVSLQTEMKWHAVADAVCTFSHDILSRRKKTWNKGKLVFCIPVNFIALTWNTAMAFVLFTYQQGTRYILQDFFSSQHSLSLPICTRMKWNTFYLVLKPSFEHFSLLLTIGSPIRQENPGIDMHVETPLVPSTFVDTLNLKKKLIWLILSLAVVHN